MRLLTGLLLIIASIDLIGQTNQVKFKESYINWIQFYYKNPEPDDLYNAFIYTNKNKDRSREESEIPILGFIATALKADNERLDHFFTQIKSTKDKDIIYSFSWILWFINSEHSLKLLTDLANQPNLKEYRQFLNDMSKKEPINIHKDDFLGLSQVNMLWYDFYATGSKETMNRIISKVDNLESEKWMDRQVAMNVIYSLRNNAIKDSQIIEYCKEFVKTSKEPTTKILKDLITEISWKD